MGTRIIMSVVTLSEAILLSILVIIRILVLEFNCFVPVNLLQGWYWATYQPCVGVQSKRCLASKNIYQH